MFFVKDIIKKYKFSEEEFTTFNVSLAPNTFVIENSVPWPWLILCPITNVVINKNKLLTLCGGKAAGMDDKICKKGKRENKYRVEEKIGSVIIFISGDWEKEHKVCFF